MRASLLVVLLAASCVGWSLDSELGDTPEHTAPTVSSALKKLMMPGKLVAGHAELEQQCDSCHGDFDDSVQAALCRDCHEAVGSDIELGEGFHGRLPVEQLSECRQCHSDHLGRDADIVQLNPRSFDHQQTDFTLQGGHLDTSCESCHSPDKPFSETPQQCSECHQQSEQHGGDEGEQCASCHSAEGWQTIQFDHDETDFGLQNAHLEVSCNSCHLDDLYQNTPTTCNSCHALDDLHRGQRGAQCQSCHSDKKWSESIYDHDKTDFPLRGGHADALCSQCHKETSYLDSAELKLQPPSEACSSCHLEQDIHLGSNGRDCEDCHSDQSWQKVEFDHAKSSDFSLLGAHQEVRCDSCHISGEIEVRSECGSCHAPDDVHYGGLGAQCQDCHGSENWAESIRFNHDLTHFPLLGMHAIAACDSCHGSGEYEQIESTCSSCHAQESPHDGQLGEQCQQCHNPNDWQLWLFDHDLQTDYPLEGEHENLQCQQCHNKRMAIPPNHEVDSVDCYQCHRQDDVHRRRFGTDCGRCHIPESFREIRIEQPL